MYYVFNIGLVSVSVATSVCVLNFHFRGHKVTEVPPWIKKLLLIKNKEIKREKIIKNKKFIQSKISEPQTYRSFLYEPYKEKHKIISMSKAEFLQTSQETEFRYLNGFMHPKKLNSADGNLGNLLQEENDSSQSENDQIFSRLNNPESYRRRSKSILHQEFKIDDNFNGNFLKIIKILKKTSKLVELTLNKKKYMQEVYDDWKEVASRLDFVLFIIASLTVVLSPIYLFGKFFLREDSEIHAKNNSCGCNLSLV